MIVKVRALLGTEAGKPSDWTQEIWDSCTISVPAGAGGSAVRLADSPPSAPNDVPEATAAAPHDGERLNNNSDGTHAPSSRDKKAPVRTSALRGLGATSNDLRSRVLHSTELAEHAEQDPRQIASITSDARARAVIHVCAMAKWTPGAAGGAGRRGDCFRPLQKRRVRRCSC